MTATTSVETWREIVDEGLVGNLQARIVKMFAMTAGGEATPGEIAFFLGMDKGTISPRISELYRLQVLYRMGRRRCTISGRPGYTFMLSGKKPVKLEQAETMAEKIQRYEKTLKTIRDIPLGPDNGSAQAQIDCAADLALKVLRGEWTP